MPTLINFSAQQLIPGYVFKCVLKTLPILTDKFSLCKLGGVNSVPFSLPLTNNFNKTKAAISPMQAGCVALFVTIDEQLQENRGCCIFRAS